MNNLETMKQDEISLKELIINIKEWVVYFKNHILYIILWGLFGSILGYTYAYFQKPTYKAVLTFALEEDRSNGGLGGALGIASSIGIDVGGGGGGAFAGNNLMDLMKSRLIIEKTLLNPIVINKDTISLAEYYIRINNLRKGWESNNNLIQIQFSPNSDRMKFNLIQDSILENISSTIINNNLTVGQIDKKSAFNSIVVESNNELFSKIFCEQLAIEITNFYIETKSKKARLNVEILQKQTDSIRDELNSAIVGVATAADNVYNLNPAYNVKRTPSTRRQVDVQANTSILTQLITQLELSKVNLRKETPLIQIIDKPILPLKKRSAGKLKYIFLGGFLSCFLTILFFGIKKLIT